MKIELGGNAGGIIKTPPTRQELAAAQAAGQLPRTTTPEPSPAPEAQDLAVVLEKLNKRFAAHRMEAQYSIDERSKDVIIKIVNADSGEVVRQIPNESALRLAAALATSAPHLLDEKA